MCMHDTTNDGWLVNFSVYAKMDCRANVILLSDKIEATMYLDPLYSSTNFVP